MFNYLKSIIIYVLKYLLDKYMLQGYVHALYGVLCNSIQTQEINEAVVAQHRKSSSSPLAPGVGKEN